VCGGGWGGGWESHGFGTRHDSSMCVMTCICVTWLIHICDVTHSYVRHDSFECATWRIHMCNMTHPYVRHDSFICATWLIHMCDMTHDVTQTSPILVNFHSHMCISSVRHDSFICATWLIHMCDMTHSYVRHVSFICATWLMTRLTPL